MKSINPYSNIVLNEYQPYSKVKVNTILTNVSQSYQEWKKISVNKRGTLFYKLANYLRVNAEKYAQIATEEMGKPIEQAIAEVKKCAMLCDFYAEHTEEFIQPKELQSNYQQSFIHYEPIGTILAIMPWNYPYWQVFRFLVPNLMAGNTGVLKHASNVSACALAIEEMLIQVGFPENVFRTLLLPSSQVKQVVQHETVKAVTLTGSEQAGSIVASQAGESIKKTVLELGGNDAFIILPSANIKQAVQGAVMGRFQNNGQSCIAAKRFFIHENIYAEFMTKFVAAVKELKIGNPLERDVFIGPLAKPHFVEELHQQVTQSVEMGATIAIGGEITGENNQFYSPTILENITEEMPAFKEELFGPVASCMKFSTVDEVIGLANNSVYGLGGSVWSENIDEAIGLAKQIETGTVTINDIVKSDPKIPFGGIKLSGYGSELSREGQLEFLNQKVIHVNH